MANDGSPGAPIGGGAPAQLPPSSFDAAMNAQNMGEAAPFHGEIVSPNTPARQGTSTAIEKPPLAHADPPLNEAQELAARDALKRGSEQLAREDPDSTRAEVLTQDEEAAYQLWKTAKDDVRLHESFEDKLITVPWGEGKSRDVTVAEMKTGYLRHIDYTRNQQRVAEIERQAQQNNQNINRFLTDLQNPKLMRQTLEDLGYGEIFETAAQELYAERLEQEKIFYDLQKKGASAEHLKYLRERDALARKQTMESRRLTRERDAARAQRAQEDTQMQQRQEQQQLSNQLAQLRPAAFKKLGMPDDAQHQAAFQEQFIALLQVGGGRGRELRDIVMDAANAAKQFVEERIGSFQQSLEQERQRASGAAQPFSPQRLPGAAPREGTGVSPARKRQMGLNDFDAEMARQNGASNGYRQ